MTSNPSGRPLDGVRVVEFGQFIAGPGATQTLADLGADVIKIESHNGDNGRGFGVSPRTRGLSGLFLAYNRGKRSIVVDMRTPQGWEIARKLALSADVVVQNVRAGVMEALKLDAIHLRAEKPSLIHVSISGFGTTGPSRARPGLDIAAQAESGMMSVTGERGGTPLKAGFPIADVSTANATASAILAALYRQARTGAGETIQTSLLAVATSVQAQLWAEYQLTGKTPERFGNAQPLVAPAADLIAVRDGHVVISAYINDHWQRLCTAIGQPELASDARFVTSNDRVRHRAALIDVLHQALGDMTGEAARALLERHSVVVGVVRTYPQVMASEDVEACGIFQPVLDELGHEHRLPGLPFTMTDSAAPDRPAAVPRLGEHSAEVLAEMGFDAGEIAQLEAAGIVGRSVPPAPPA